MRKLYSIYALSLLLLAFVAPSLFSSDVEKTTVKKKFPIPAGFVYLQDIDPSIIQSVRYAGKENFTGKPGEGYNSFTIIMTQEAAEALKKVQADALKDGYCLVVYDAYRPVRAVNEFVDWTHFITNQKLKALYHPYIDKKDLFPKGYIATHSGHSRGSTVDLTLIKKDEYPHPLQYIQRFFTDGRKFTYLDDGTLDMGSHWDLFDEASHHDSDLVAPEYLSRRNYLRQLMNKHDFQEYHKEWWHYTLKDEPFPYSYFNFNVE